MDGSVLSPYPHLSWFANELVIRPPRLFSLYSYKAVAHRLVVTEDGDAACAWTTGGATVPFHMNVGDLGFFPGDGSMHTLGLTAPGFFQACEVIVPQRHVEGVCETEGVRHAVHFRASPVFRDTLMRASLLRLVAGRERGHLMEDIGAEIAARHVVLGLCVLAGASPPDWHADDSVFVPHVMRQIVDRVDAHLAGRPSLPQISEGFGLSPSHFARKFQKSTGLSLNRFMNRRRIALSLELLKTWTGKLSQLSLDLGFCSQSHFTRLFSSLTGITPHQFRRSCRPLGD